MGDLQVISLNRDTVAVAHRMAQDVAGEEFQMGGSLQIFDLSPHHSIAVAVSCEVSSMFDDLSGAIAKFGNSLPPFQLSTVKDYANRLLQFLATKHIPETCQQRENVRRIILSLCFDFSEQISEIANREELRGCSSDDMASVIQEEVFAPLKMIFQDVGQCESFSSCSEEALRKKYQPDVQQELRSLFREVKLGDNVYSHLEEVVFSHIRSNTFSDEKAVLVVMGFGQSECQPHVAQIASDGFVDGRLKAALIHSHCNIPCLLTSGDDAGVHSFVRDLDSQSMSLIGGFDDMKSEELAEVTLVLASVPRVADTVRDVEVMFNCAYVTKAGVFWHAKGLFWPEHHAREFEELELRSVSQRQPTLH